MRSFENVLRCGGAALAIAGSLNLASDSQTSPAPIDPDTSHHLHLPYTPNRIIDQIEGINVAVEAQIPTIPDASEAPFNNYMPQIETEKRTWATLPEDIATLSEKQGITISPEDIFFEGFFGYDLITQEIFRRLALVEGEQSAKGTKDYLDKHFGVNLKDLAEKIYFNSIASITNIRNETLDVGATTYISPEEPHTIISWFGDEMKLSLKMVPDEMRGQKDNLFMYREKTPNVSDVLIEARSILAIWDTYRHSKSYSDIEVAVPFNQLYDLLRLTQTRAYMPFDLETPTARQDYLTILNTLNALLERPTHEGKRDRGYTDTKESAAADIANHIVPTNSELAEPLVEMSVETVNGTRGGVLYKKIHAMVAEGRLPEIAAAGSTDPNELKLPDGITSIAVLDHRYKPEAITGPKGEHGYVVRLITFDKAVDGKVTLPYPDDYTMTTSFPGLTIDVNQVYGIGITDSDQPALFIPLSAFNNGIGLPDGYAIDTTFRYSEVEKKSKMVWKWEGNVPTNVFAPSYTDDKLQAPDYFRPIGLHPLIDLKKGVNGIVPLGTANNLTTQAEITNSYAIPHPLINMNNGDHGVVPPWTNNKLLVYPFNPSYALGDVVRLGKTEMSVGENETLIDYSRGIIPRGTKIPFSGGDLVNK